MHLAMGTIDSFAAWSVEKRRDNQLLMADFIGCTRSWLTIDPLLTDDGHATRLYFGSAAVPMNDGKTGRSRLGFGFNALLGFLKVYSRVLLYAARFRLIRQLR